ncbi:glyoxalase [Planobispora rosea]|uniref:Glyoxalase n=1 Tax=Planobispora rosea TaxID=35762 RepID=A0A8J3RZ43_PLARO|nr:VOC family protein [Planobispora rosea]GGS51457.1 glyoxalase [Planobispora rosea]GIH82926.1 glyoxalase [Planobispora rosea]
MASRVRWIDFDCENPYELAGFWSAALGHPQHEDDRPDDDECEVVVPPEVGYSMLFQRVSGKKSAKNRIHLDLVPTDRSREEEVERLLKLGATMLEDHRREDGTGWVVLADPEGNEFCVERRRD